MEVAEFGMSAAKFRVERGPALRGAGDNSADFKTRKSMVSKGM
jgi:hypothetical protein